MRWGTREQTICIYRCALFTVWGAVLQEFQEHVLNEYCYHSAQHLTTNSWWTEIRHKTACWPVDWFVFGSLLPRYVLGSACATLVPVVGLMPIRSIEQMPSMAVFMGFQAGWEGPRVGQQELANKFNLFDLFNLLLSFASRHPILQNIANMVGRPDRPDRPCLHHALWGVGTLRPLAKETSHERPAFFLLPGQRFCDHRCCDLCCVLESWQSEQLLLCQPAPSAVLLQLFMKETADTRQTMGINCGIAVIESWEREGEVYNRNRVRGSTTFHILCKSICICNHMYTICGLEYMYTLYTIRILCIQYTIYLIILYTVYTCA